MEPPTAAPDIVIHVYRAKVWDAGSYQGMLNSRLSGAITTSQPSRGF